MPLSSRPGGFNIRALEERGNPFFHAQKMKTTAYLSLGLSSSPFGLITTRFVPFLYALSRSSDGRLIHRHGEAKITVEELLAWTESNRS
jgi:hypothetical protein